MIVNTYLHSKGFTLIETMVAIAVLLTAVVGPMSLIGNTLNHIYFATDELTAVNLAQEGIEIVRQRRDTNFLEGNLWDTDFGTGDCAGGLTCIIDTNPTLEIHKCSGLCTEKQIYKDINDGFYHQYSGAVPLTAIASPYTRTVHTTKVNNNEYVVTVNVDWNTRGIPGSISVSESIFRWANL